ncbi:tannase and feruloyl esterase [Xylaria arbuscula]|nr:tannase and feruloyl esterase [Xylaria arbuscula]
MVYLLGISLALGSLVQGCLGTTLLSPITSCSSLTVTPPDGTTLINATAIERYNVNYSLPTYNGVAGYVNVCDVEVFLTHGDAGDAVRFAIYLPLDGWNGRWQGTGGGGWAAGGFDFELVAAATSGYSAGATDAGVNLEGKTEYWYNSTQLNENFVYLSFHEMTLIGKDLSEKFYGKRPDYSYWFGCSQGGRQGMSEAQLYPEDYDGIFAGAPAISWEKVAVAGYWPLAVQNQIGESIPLCKLDAIQQAIIAACDLLDGAADGLISNPLKCDFDAIEVVGMQLQCDENTTATITEQDAIVWNKIRTGLTDEEGNLLWYGLEPGTYNGALATPGFDIATRWIADWLLQDPDADVSNITENELAEFFYQSVSELGALWGTDNPDLSAFRERGGKIMTWHGWADEIIPPLGTVDYWQRVVELAGGVESTDEFYRIFMAPGLGHCGSENSYGPQIPIDNLAPLVEWVENGKAPEMIFFSGNGQTRNICKFPKELVYCGSGDISDAASWECV